MNSPFRRIIGYNLLIMLATAVIFRLPVLGQGAGLAVLLFPALVVVLMAIWNVGSALSADSPEEQRAHWLGLLLVLLIGIGTCALPVLT